MWRRFLSVLLCLALAGGPMVQAETIVIVKGSHAVILTVAGTEFGITKVDRLVDLDGPTPPDTPLPDGTLKTLAAQWRTLVPEYPQRNAHRLALGATHSVLATSIASGGFTDLAQLQSRTKQMTDLLLGDDKTKWANWAAPIVVQLDRLSTLPEAQRAFEEIADGLTQGEALSPEILALIQVILKILEDQGINPRLLAIVQLVLQILGGFPAGDSSAPDNPSEDSSRDGQSGVSSGERELVAVRRLPSRDGYLDFRSAP